MKGFFRRASALMLVIILIVIAAVPAFAVNDNVNKRTVKVGYMDYPGFMEKDSFGEIVGYGAEYLEEICKHVDWDIEYVRAPWKEQLRMLELGELDIVPMAQWSPEREKRFGYSSQPMGIIQCLLIVRGNNNDIYYNDFDSFDGKKIGIQRGSRNAELLRIYAESKGFSYELAEYDYQNQLESALVSGEIDIMACEQMVSRDNIRIVGHFGSDLYYFITNKNDRELLKELNSVISGINSYDATYQADLYKKYFGNNSANNQPYFTREEAEAIKSVGEITCALIPDSQPASYKDKDGKIKGIVPDVLNTISELSGIKFKYTFVPYDMTPLEYMQKNPDVWIGGIIQNNPAFDKEDILVSDSFYTSYSGLAVKSGKFNEIDLENGSYSIGVPKSFQAMQLFLKDNYPNLKVNTNYETSEEGLNAVVDGDIDIFAYGINILLPLTGSPRFNNINIIANHFMEENEAIVAMNTPENEVLMGVIDKCIDAIPQETIDKIEKENLRENFYHPTSSDMIYQMRLPLLFISAVILLMFLFMLAGKHKDKSNNTLIRRKNKQLTEALELAERASRAKGEFLSHMSHDIRTPMNAIVGMALLAREEKCDNPKIMDYLDKISASSELLMGLLNDILDSAAIESGKFRIAHEAFDLRKALKPIIEIHNSRCEEKGISFRFDYYVEGEYRLIGDTLRLNQILLNLLSNAYKFTETGGKVVLAVEEVKNSDKVVLLSFRVSDTGCGMDNELMSRIFNPFEQKDSTTAHKYGGSGLGLNIVKNLVDMMEGRVKVISSEGVGTTFIVELPFEVDRSAANVTRDTEAEEEAYNDNLAKRKDYDFTGKRILVADDDAFNRDVVKGILELVNFEVKTVDDGEKALNEFLNSPRGGYDAILLDVHMPLLDGYAAAKKIRASSHPDAGLIPIYAMTADAYPEDIEKAVASGMNGHLSKPLYPNVLYKTLAEGFEAKNSEVSEKCEA